MGIKWRCDVFSVECENRLIIESAEGSYSFVLNEDSFTSARFTCSLLKAYRTPPIVSEGLPPVAVEVFSLASVLCSGCPDKLSG